MKKTHILLAFLIAFFVFGIADAQRGRSKRKSVARTHKTVNKKAVKKRKAVARKKKVAVRPPTIHENPFVQCEDTCEHIHGIDLSHYQGEVFWEAVGENTRTAYVYLKATEGGDRIDSHYERNIDLAHRYGLKVGSYHFFRPRTNLVDQLENFKTQCLPGEQDLIPMLDVETTGGMETEEFCDSLFKFLSLMEDAYHQKPLIYTGRNFYNRHLQGLVDDYQLMIAMYTDEEPELADGRDICMWQYTSKGRIIGISGNVDKSRFMGEHSLREIRFRH
jgi:lysozyme